MGPPLQELIRRTATGDQRAFATLYAQTSAQLFAIALRISGRRDIAEEILQEAFAAVWRRAPDYDPARGPAMGWLAAIVRHCTIDQLRHRRSRPEGYPAPETALAALADAARTDSGAELRALQRCLDELEPQPRRAVLLSYFYGFTRNELAARLEAPVGTVKSWIRRSLERLQRCLDR